MLSHLCHIQHIFGVGATYICRQATTLDNFRKDDTQKANVRYDALLRTPRCWRSVLIQHSRKESSCEGFKSYTPREIVFEIENVLRRKAFCAPHAFTERIHAQDFIKKRRIKFTSERKTQPRRRAADQRRFSRKTSPRLTDP